MFKEESMEKYIENAISESIELHGRLSSLIPVIKEAALASVRSIKTGGKVMFAGNGGSAADAQHLCAELVNRFLRERRPLAGLALTTDTSNITSIANDYSFDEIFSKQVEALGKPGDVFFGISTSGNSPNIIKAINICRELDIHTIGLTGEGGGKMKDMCDTLIAVPSKMTPRIQEVHILVGHILCGLIEDFAL